MGRASSGRAASHDARPEYDFSGGERGVAYRPMERGYTIREERPDGTYTETYVPPEEGAIVLDPDVRKYFPDSESVNKALRAIITLFPKQSTAPKRRAASAR